MFLLSAVDSYEGLYNLLSGCGAEAVKRANWNFKKTTAGGQTLSLLFSCEMHYRKEAS